MSIPIQFSLEQILAITRQLPNDVKVLLIQELLKELAHTGALQKTPIVSLDGYDQPIDLEKVTFSKKDLEGLQQLWKDEPSAEELVKQL